MIGICFLISLVTAARGFHHIISYLAFLYHPEFKFNILKVKLTHFDFQLGRKLDFFQLLLTYFKWVLFGVLPLCMHINNFYVSLEGISSVHHTKNNVIIIKNKNGVLVMASSLFSFFRKNTDMPILLLLNKESLVPDGD